MEVLIYMLKPRRFKEIISFHLDRTVHSSNMILIFCLHVQILRWVREYQILDISARMEDSHNSGQAVPL